MGCGKHGETGRRACGQVPAACAWGVQNFPPSTEPSARSTGAPTGAVEKIPAHCFKLDLNGSDTVISFDRRHLNQILWNLCKNGWRHSKQIDNSLKLSVLIKTQTIQIEISDDGEGIPENVRHHLFEPFFTTEKSGTGLGLYIARELADANGAKLQHKINNHHKLPNLGAQFIIYIKKA